METEPAVQNDDLMVTGNITGTLDRPKTLADDHYGTDTIGADELRLPRLACAQGLSPQTTEGSSTYIDGLRPIDLFNDLTSEILGRGPITFVPVRRDVRRIEFRPRAEGGGVIDMDVPPGDLRLKWTGIGADRQPPAATRFTEFIVLLLRPGKRPEPIVLAIKDTNKFNRRAAEQLTSFIKLRDASIYAGMYTVSSIAEKNDKGTFGVYVIKNAGFIPVDTPAGRKLYDYAEGFAKSLEGKKVVVDREPGIDDGDDPPPPAGDTDM